MSDTTGIFTPLADDTFAAPTPHIWEVMTVKESGYINHRGAFPEGQVLIAVAAVKNYFESQERDEPTVYVRVVGSLTWADVAYMHPFITPDDIAGI